jgi:hypothetical protein
MDTHKKEHSVAVHFPGREEIVRLTVRNTAGEIGKLVRRIRREAPGHRLRKRYWYLVNRGKIPCKATVAIARELAGFLWAIFREYEIRNRSVTIRVIR